MTDSKLFKFTYEKVATVIRRGEVMMWAGGNNGWAALENACFFLLPKLRA